MEGLGLLSPISRETKNISCQPHIYLLAAPDL